MVIQNYRDIKHRAGQALDYTPWDIKKLVLVFSLALLCASPILIGVDALLALGMNSAGGLGGLAVYSLLATVSSTLSLAFTVFSLFWGPAISYCALMVLRQQDPWPRGLFRGFKKWLSVLKYNLLIVAFLIALVIAISPFAAMLSLPLMEDYVQIIENAPQDEAAMMTYLESIPMEQLTMSLIPMVLIVAGLILVVTVPLSYRIRIALLLQLDEEQIGTREAIRFSFRATKGSCKQLFFMDLSFWWYYILLALSTAVPFLSLLPVFSGWNSTLVSLLFSVLSALATLGVYMLGLMKVSMADAVAYDHLRTQVLTDLPQLTEGTEYGTNL